MTQSTTTQDHDMIRHWAEARDGHPAKVSTDGTGGILRIDFGTPEDNLSRITWEEFFTIFDAENLAFLYQEKTSDGQPSRFCKFLSAE